MHVNATQSSLKHVTRRAYTPAFDNASEDLRHKYQQLAN